MQDFLTAAEPIIKRKARSLSHANPGIESDDIEQTIRLGFIEDKVYARGFNLEDKDDTKQVEIIAWNIGNKYCITERYDYDFHSAQYVYTPKEIRGLFTEAFYSREPFLAAPQKDDGIKISANGVTVALWDMDAAYAQLDPAEQISLERHYKLGLPFEDKSEEHRVYRAIDKVTRSLNRAVAMRGVEPVEHEGPGARRAMSNAAANALTNNNY